MRPTKIPTLVIILTPICIALFVGMAVAELICIAVGHPVPIAARQWVLTIAITSTILTSLLWKVRAIADIQTQLDRNHAILQSYAQHGNSEQLTEDLRDIIHAEVHTELHTELPSAVSRAMEPTLVAIRDASHFGNFNPVTPINSRKD
jgi:hypothetical protein